MPYFKPTRGIRQGDPLSPYLFTLVSNVLSILIKQAVSAGTIGGIKLSHGCPTLSHLLFADDSIFFPTWNYNRMSESSSYSTSILLCF